MLNPTQIQTIINGIMPLHPTMIGIFGSYARGEQHKDSDLDILMDYETVPPWSAFIKVHDELSEQLGMKVDLVTMRGLSPYVKPYIEKDLKVIYHAEGR